jgi:hypothetical protein
MRANFGWRHLKGQKTATEATPAKRIVNNSTGKNILLTVDWDIRLQGGDVEVL